MAEPSVPPHRPATDPWRALAEPDRRAAAQHHLRRALTTLVRADAELDWWG
jgi:hypothetical protein